MPITKDGLLVPKTDEERQWLAISVALVEAQKADAADQRGVGAPLAIAQRMYDLGIRAGALQRQKGESK
jgi:hypothetical protein